ARPRARGRPQRHRPRRPRLRPTPDRPRPARRRAAARPGRARLPVDAEVRRAHRRRRRAHRRATRPAPAGHPASTRPLTLHPPPPKEHHEMQDWRDRIGPLGVWAPTDGMTTEEAVAFVRLLEELGYGALWLPETLGRDPF